jgi:sulfhydrogenase subunit gamma (sulfur reductase)
MQNDYKPQKAKITKIVPMSGNVKMFRLKPSKALAKGRNGLSFTPGQFFLVGIWGYGEAPFGGASSPYKRKFVDFGIRKEGEVTTALHNLQEGDEATIRGPYGNGFPLDFFEGKDIVAVTGGCGIPPLAALMEYVAVNRKKFGNVYFLYGAHTPKDLLFKDLYPRWEKEGIKVILTVDEPTPDWKGYVGLVSKLVEEIEINPRNAVSAMCGPGPMTNALENILRPLGISDRRIFVSEERKMYCGIGKCQHCTTGDKYVCTDGPVLNFDQVQGNWD